MQSQLDRERSVPRLTFLLVAISLFFPSLAAADGSLLGFNWYLRDKAVPDECWCGLTPDVPGTSFDQYGLTPPFNFTQSNGTCAVDLCPVYDADADGNLTPDGTKLAVPKVNMAYIWSLDEAPYQGDKGQMWYGTVASGNCITGGALSSFGGQDGGTPSVQSIGVCEYASSPYSERHDPPQSTTLDPRDPVPGLGLIPGYLGDWRPPRIYYYDRATKLHTDVTPTEIQAGDPDNDFGVADVVLDTVGWRSIVVLGKLVIAGGQSISGGANFVAFNAATKAYLGSYHDDRFSNVRKWAVVGGRGYLAVGQDIPGTGYVLKWKGRVDGDPFNFDFVGRFGGVGAYIAEHQGRLYVHTWQGFTDFASLMMSPRIPWFGGLRGVSRDSYNVLTAAFVPKWERVWRADEYEPDPLLARAYAGGAIASYAGYLYFGTLHLGGAAQIAALPYLLSGASAEAVAAGTSRSIALFRGKNLHDPARRKIELLYGSETLSKFDYGTSAFVPTPNNLGQTPKYGPSGLASTSNRYTWDMAVWKPRPWRHILLFGTLDTTSPTGDDPEAGADLYVIPNPYSAAIPLSLTGVGNKFNYGVRNIKPTKDGKSIFLGTANPRSLATDLGDDLPEGGWELIELRPK